jgi:hypothetical protein
VARMVLVVGGIAVAVAVVWVLGPGARLWLVHVDGVKVGGKDGLTGKDLAAALDTVRGRAMSLGTGLLAAAAIYYTASNAVSARRSAQAAIEGVEAARRSAEATEAAQRRTFELTEEGQRRSHELTEQGQRTDRFTAAVSQLGDSSPAIQLGGVHALAGLAEDAPTREFRQTCIDVLCAYLRLPYDPDPGDAPADGQDPAEHARARTVYRAVREVRHTVIRVIGNHLRAGAVVSWQGHDFDFTDVVFDGGGFYKVLFTSGNVSFAGARFAGGVVDFRGARFAGGEVDFRGARFEGGRVHFVDAQFEGGTVSFVGAYFEGGTVDFRGARFMGSVVYFLLARFAGGAVSFMSARFEGGRVHFEGARFTGGWVAFMNARFESSWVPFRGAQFEGGEVDFDSAVGQRPAGLPDDMATHLSE